METLKAEDLTEDYLKSILSYDPHTGVFLWRAPTGRRAKKGSIAGSRSDQGYVYIRIHRRLFRAHRLAFLYMEGALPETFVDHINGDKSDNRWVNLRKASLTENNRNNRNRPMGESGYRGVCRRPGGSTWIAGITVNRKRIHLGSFATKEQAAQAYRDAAEKYHKEFSCVSNFSTETEREKERVASS